MERYVYNIVNGSRHCGHQGLCLYVDQRRMQHTLQCTYLEARLFTLRSRGQCKLNFLSTLSQPAGASLLRTIQGFAFRDLSNSCKVQPVRLIKSLFPILDTHDIIAQDSLLSHKSRSVAYGIESPPVQVFTAFHLRGLLHRDVIHTDSTDPRSVVMVLDRLT